MATTLRRKKSIKQISERGVVNSDVGWSTRRLEVGLGRPYRKGRAPHRPHRCDPICFHRIDMERDVDEYYSPGRWWEVDHQGVRDSQLVISLIVDLTIVT
ncbi:hypothetical protein PM082_004831 [Marasmius tenuissimus]|nr:hypothetical protein PM082_004831 [Marasmius tenuissimus]